MQLFNQILPECVKGCGSVGQVDFPYGNCEINGRTEGMFEAAQRARRWFGQGEFSVTSLKNGLI
jgi:hypothetical protein